ncbi:AAA family ATPase [Yersinia kristensenii]
MNINLNSKINIITGDNGSGKSTILSEIAIQEYKNGNNVICISNTPLHKFKRNTTSRYHVLKQTSRALDDSLKK